MLSSPLPRRGLLGLALLPGIAGIARAQAPVAVVASFSILGDLVRQVAGDRARLRVLVGPDADAHDFQPRPSDAAAIRDAALVVRNGLGFEPWMDRLLRAAGGSPKVATAAQDVTPRRLPGGAVDPHAWQDVGNAVLYARRIAAALAEADPAGAATHATAGEALAARLRALDAWVREQVATVPPARRVVVTTHDAFGYFAAAYGVEFRAAQGISTEAEPSAAAVGRLIRQIRAENITAVFVENLRNQTAQRRLAAEAGVRLRGSLYADSLSPPDGPAPTYEAMIRHNVGLLVPAMRGEG
ncbi:zinc ABC transporter substrate-binding protein [Roseomonas sp. NAR14]|uniref:Zinc ABC transporter substrate-binding protein n=1 Tax=Roseomonas acroporae TaxID=2937791 RepID=A0A9X1YBI8_9PROT|nr:zinc ABC transporter substrate-binding protein [Roseomonas acroporae]MCK8786278.1 zinc ABC transporter substrate-binding protein [Roseomonas acroporae]